MSYLASFKFFMEHASVSYNPMTQTREQGQQQGAERMVDAEDVLMLAMRVGDVSVHWADDERMGDEPDDVENVESCVIEINGEIVASLFAIWDADTNYRRVVRAELALECLGRLRAVLCNAA